MLTEQHMTTKAPLALTFFHPSLENSLKERTTSQRLENIAAKKNNMFPALHFLTCYHLDPATELCEHNSEHSNGPTDSLL